MIYCFIDIGTNSIRYLVKNKNIILEKETETVQLGKNFNKKIILEKIKLAEKILFNIKINLEKKYKKIKYEVFGTYILRVAENTDFIIKIVKKIFNVRLKVLSEKEEALYSVKGILSSEKIKSKLKNKDNIMFVDIGGGSTEITCSIISEKIKITKSKSLDMGALLLQQKFFKKFDFNKSNTEKTIKYIKNKLNIVDDFFEQVNKIVFCAGTATTLGAVLLVQNKYNGDEIDGLSVDLYNLNQILLLLSDMKPIEIKKIPGIFKNREKIIYPGLLILHTILLKSKLKKLYISDRGILFFK